MAERSAGTKRQAASNTRGSRRKKAGSGLVGKLKPAIVAGQTSDRALSTLLKRLKAADDATDVRQLSDQLERVIFHKQYKNA
jgi:hypothetical protein